MNCRKHNDQPLFMCRPCYDESFRLEWRVASGAGVRLAWWVLRDATWEERRAGRPFRIGLEGKGGVIRKFKTRAAAQRIADTLNSTNN